MMERTTRRTAYKTPRKGTPAMKRSSEQGNGSAQVINDV